MKKLFAMMMCSALMFGIAGASAADSTNEHGMKNGDRNQIPHDGKHKGGKKECRGQNCINKKHVDKNADKHRGMKKDDMAGDGQRNNDRPQGAADQ